MCVFFNFLEHSDSVFVCYPYSRVFTLNHREEIVVRHIGVAGPRIVDLHIDEKFNILMKKNTVPGNTGAHQYELMKITIISETTKIGCVKQATDHEVERSIG